MVFFIAGPIFAPRFLILDSKSVGSGIKGGQGSRITAPASGITTSHGIEIGCFCFVLPFLWDQGTKICHAFGTRNLGTKMESAMKTHISLQHGYYMAANGYACESAKISGFHSYRNPPYNSLFYKRGRGELFMTISTVTDRLFCFIT